MKKLLVGLLCLTSLLQATDLIEPAFGLWGLGASVKDSNYRSVSKEVGLAPYIFGGYGIVNIEANRANINLYAKDGLFFAVVAQLRTHQSHKDLDKENAIELGGHIGYVLGAGFISRLVFLQDVSNEHKGNELELQVYRHDSLGKVRILSALSLQRESRGLLDYYYGTSSYHPQEGFAGELEMIFTYPIKNFGLFAGFRHYRYDQEVKNSPLTDSNKITQGFFGAGYQF